MAEDILGGCIYRGIAAPGRAGWPTGHVGQLRWPCRSPLGLRQQGGRRPTPCWHAGFNIGSFNIGSKFNKMPNSCTAREILVHDSVRLFGLRRS